MDCPSGYLPAGNGQCDCTKVRAMEIIDEVRSRWNGGVLCWRLRLVICHGTGNMDTAICHPHCSIKDKAMHIQGGRRHCLWLCSGKMEIGRKPWIKLERYSKRLPWLRRAWTAKTDWITKQDDYAVKWILIIMNSFQPTTWSGILLILGRRGEVPA